MSMVRQAALGGGPRVGLWRATPMSYKVWEGAVPRSRDGVPTRRLPAEEGIREDADSPPGFIQRSDASVP